MICIQRVNHVVYKSSAQASGIRESVGDGQGQWTQINKSDKTVTHEWSHSLARMLLSASVCRVVSRKTELIIDSIRRKLLHTVQQTNLINLHNKKIWAQCLLKVGILFC